MVKIIDDNGCEIYVIALIDQCSQASFVSEYVFRKLKIAYQSIKLPNTGIAGKNNFICKKLVSICVKPHFYSDFSVDVMAHVIPKITSYSSSFNFDSSKSYLSNLTLADPHFNTIERIEILLGSTVHAFIIEEGIRKGNPNELIAMKTKFGWVLSVNSGIGSNCC